MRFSIVIVSWNSAPELSRLLPTVEQHLGDNCSLVVVDNASKDQSVEVVSSWNGSVRVVRLDENRGFGAANNIGVRCAESDVVVLLNPDTRLVDGSLLDLADLAHRTGSLCGPRLLNEDGTIQPSASAMPGGWEVVLRAFVPARIMPQPLRVRCEPWRSTARVRVGWLTGACLAARREVLLALGPFDERIHLFGEDLDLCLRAAPQGVERLFAPDTARVVHLGGRASFRRYGDAGLAQKIASRETVVQLRLGSGRARLDAASELAFHASRFAAKRLLGETAERERAWLRTRIRRTGSTRI